MSRIGTSLVRTSSMLSGDQLLSALRRTQTELLKVQTQLSTGNKVNTPSDAPESASMILALQQQLTRREQHTANLTQADAVLTGVDASLAEITTILRDAVGVAQSQQDLLSDTATRQEMAEVISGQIQSLLSFANQKTQSVFLFGGDGQVRGNAVMSDFAGGGIRYSGTDGNLMIDVGLANPVAFNSNAVQAFGSVSARVEGTVDLNPSIAGARLDDLEGALGEGIRRGSVILTVNSTEVTVDLTDADTLDDVRRRLTAAINSAQPGAGLVYVSTNGLSLYINDACAIGIKDAAQGHTAADLGIDCPITSGLTTLPGDDLNPRLTATTPLSALTSVTDWSGLTITQGTTTKSVNFTTARNIGDLITMVDQLDLGVRLEINEAGDGLNLVSDVSGLDLTVSENGGSTAAQLGLRTLGLGTKLSDLNHGAGVEGIAGEDDFEIFLHDGRSFRVSVSGLETIDDLLSAMRSAAAAAGVNPAQFQADIASAGSGIVLHDLTAGANDFKIEALTVDGKTSWAADDLGFTTDTANAGASDTLASEDRATVRVESVFTHMKALQDALLTGDTRGIAFAANKLQGDLDRAVNARAEAGVRMAWVQQTQERSEDLKLAEETMLTNLQGADPTEAITRYTQLMAQLEATLRVGAVGSQLSLLDFLR